MYFVNKKCTSVNLNNFVSFQTWILCSDQNYNLVWWICYDDEKFLICINNPKNSRFAHGHVSKSV